MNLVLGMLIGAALMLLLVRPLRQSALLALDHSLGPLAFKLGLQTPRRIGRVAMLRIERASAAMPRGALLPSDVRISLSEIEYRRHGEIVFDQVASELARSMRDLAADATNDYRLLADPRVQIRPSALVSPGAIDVAAWFSEATVAMMVEEQGRLLSDSFPGDDIAGSDPVNLHLASEHTGELVRLLDEPIVIGSADHCDLCMPDPTLEREHARVSPVDSQTAMLEALTVRRTITLHGQFVDPGHPVVMRTGEVVHLSRTVRLSCTQGSSEQS